LCQCHPQDQQKDKNDMFHQSKSSSDLLSWGCKLLFTCIVLYSEILVLSPNGQRGRLLGLRN